MEENESSQTIKLYPLNNEFIASFQFKLDESLINQRLMETVIILDRSGSMGYYVEEIITKILPKFFENLNYDPESVINLIAFESQTELHKMKVKEFKYSKLRSAGGTEMSPAVTELHKLFEQFNKTKVNALRILTISDGEIFDQALTKEFGDKLAEFAAHCNISTNSQAIRYFTSRCSPDTTAICSLLQLNNVERSKLTDVKAKNDAEKIAEEMSALFINDGFNRLQLLESSRAVFFKFPWDDEAVENLPLLPGQNVFWMKELPTETLKINEKPIKVKIIENVTLENIKSLIDSKIDFVFDRMKILKVVNTENAKKIISKIVEYFGQVEDTLGNLIPPEELDAKNIANRARIIKMNAIREKKITQYLQTIANDENVEKLNAEQKAAYLRSVDKNSKAGKGLAMRSAKKAKKRGIEMSFDEVVRKQTLDMAAHFDEIKDIDYKNHEVSFYSQATTFEGIRMLVEFSQDGSFNKFDADEILQILNIVGVACVGPIGEFPDASTWPITEVLAGCYVSVADIITAHHQSGSDPQKALKAPGLDKEITNVIPVFDDPRIGIFLKTYAPSLLEFSSSIGMRRIIADVPMTFGYTVIAGIRRLAYELNKNKSSAHLEAFGKIVNSALSFIGKYYDHIEELLEVKENEGFSHYLASHGIANLIVPLIRAIKKKKNVNFPTILRSVYSREIWKGVVKEHKDKAEFLAITRGILYKILNIDLEKKKILPKEIFEAEPENLDFPSDFHVNRELVDQLTSSLYYHNYMTLLPKFLKAAVIGKLDDIKTIPPMTKSSITEAFDVDYSYSDFIFLNVFNGLRYPLNRMRCDEKEKKMKIIDLKDYEKAISEVKNYVSLQYRGVYEKALKEKKHKEQEILAEKFIEDLLSTKDPSSASQLWRNGITKNSVHYKLKNTSSIGFKNLTKRLADSELKIPLRSHLIEILLTGRDKSGEIIYNNGEFCGFKKVEKFLQLLSPDEKKAVEEKISEKSIHVYREKANRHSHGNDHKSYRAIGFGTLFDYFKSLGEHSEITNYCYKHTSCCNSWNMNNAYTYKDIRMAYVKRTQWRKGERRRRH